MKSMNLNVYYMIISIKKYYRYLFRTLRTNWHKKKSSPNKIWLLFTEHLREHFPLSCSHNHINNFWMMEKQMKVTKKKCEDNAQIIIISYDWLPFRIHCISTPVYVLSKTNKQKLQTKNLTNQKMNRKHCITGLFLA